MGRPTIKVNLDKEERQEIEKAVRKTMIAKKLTGYGSFCLKMMDIPTSSSLGYYKWVATK